MLHNAVERDAYLDHACAGDANLRERVGKLLAADEQKIAVGSGGLHRGRATSHFSARLESRRSDWATITCYRKSGKAAWTRTRNAGAGDQP